MIKQFRSVAVTVTPFIKENKPDLEEIALQTAKFGESGIDAIFPCASTGEYVKMSAEDKCDILKTVAVNNKGKKALVAGACAASASEAKIYIETAKKSKILDGNPFVYFVHSYCIKPEDESIISAYTEYGSRFAVAVEKDNVFAVQFHPEKSGSEGMDILRRFAALGGDR